MNQKIVTEIELDGFSSVGKVRDAHGLKGELFFIFFAKEAPWLKSLNEITIIRNEKDSEGKPIRVMYTLLKKRAKTHKVGSIMKLEGIEDRTSAEKFRGAELYIPTSILVSKPGDTVYLREVLGFEVLDSEDNPVGTISGFSSNGAQDLLVVKGASGNSEIPFIEPFVRKIIWKKKQVAMDFPSELLDVKNLLQ